MPKEALGIFLATAGFWIIRAVTGYDLLGERGFGDYIMLLFAPLAFSVWLTVYCKGRLRWSYGVLAVTIYCFGHMLQMGATGYAAGYDDRTLLIMGVTSLNWAVLSLFALIGGGAGGMYYKLRELSAMLRD